MAAGKKIYYVIELDTKKGVAGMKRMTKGMGDSFKTVEKQSKKSSSSVMNHWKAIAVGIAAVYGKKLIDSVIRTSIEFDKWNRTLEVTTKGLQTLTQAQTFLRIESERLGLVYLDQMKGYAQLTAAARASGIDMKEIEGVWLAIAEGSSVYQLSAEDSYQATRAIIQMFQKGTISAEELRGQLGERLPGALQIMAKSLNVTQMELLKLMEEGKLLASEVLPKWSAAYSKYLEEKIPTAAQAASREINRFINTLNEFKKSIGDAGLLDIFVGLLKEIGILMKESGLPEWVKNNQKLIKLEVHKWLERVRSSLRAVKSILSFVNKYSTQLLFTLKGLLILKVAAWIYGVALALKVLTISMGVAIFGQGGITQFLWVWKDFAKVAKSGTKRLASLKAGWTGLGQAIKSGSGGFLKGVYLFFSNPYILGAAALLGGIALAWIYLRDTAAKTSKEFGKLLEEELFKTEELHKKRTELAKTDLELQKELLKTMIEDKNVGSIITAQRAQVKRAEIQLKYQEKINKLLGTEFALRYKVEGIAEKMVDEIRGISASKISAEVDKIRKALEEEDLTEKLRIKGGTEKAEVEFQKLFIRMLKMRGHNEAAEVLQVRDKYKKLKELHGEFYDFGIFELVELEKIKKKYIDIEIKDYNEYVTKMMELEVEKANKIGEMTVLEQEEKEEMWKKIFDVRKYMSDQILKLDAEALSILIAQQQAAIELIREGWQSLNETVSQGFAEVFVDLITTSENVGDILKRVFGDILKDLATMFAKSAFLDILKAMFGEAKGTGGNWLSDMIFSVIGSGGASTVTLGGGTDPGTYYKGAMGGIAQGGFRAFANGGIVNKPTLGLIGEGKTNEAVVPLPDGRSIPVSGGGGGTTNIFIQAMDSESFNDYVRRNPQSVVNVVKDEVDKGRGRMIASIRKAGAMR